MVSVRRTWIERIPGIGGAAASCNRQHFIAHEMQPDAGRFGLVEEISLDGLPRVTAQVLPSVALGENVVRETFRHEASVRLGSDTKNNFHGTKVCAPPVKNKFGSGETGGFIPVRPRTTPPQLLKR
jgi:hypothetical protein